jgi:hypothetical protein
MAAAYQRNISVASSENGGSGRKWQRNGGKHRKRGGWRKNINGEMAQRAAASAAAAAKSMAAAAAASWRHQRMTA